MPEIELRSSAVWSPSYIQSKIHELMRACATDDRMLMLNCYTRSSDLYELLVDVFRNDARQGVLSTDPASAASSSSSSAPPPAAAAAAAAATTSSSLTSAPPSVSTSPAPTTRVLAIKYISTTVYRKDGKPDGGLHVGVFLHLGKKSRKSFPRLPQSEHYWIIDLTNAQFQISLIAKFPEPTDKEAMAEFKTVVGIGGLWVHAKSKEQAIELWAKGLSKWKHFKDLKRNCDVSDLLQNVGAM